MESHHCDSQMLAVGQSFVGGEGMRQMKGHVLPIASQIDWHLDPLK